MDSEALAGTGNEPPRHTKTEDGGKTSRLANRFACGVAAGPPCVASPRVQITLCDAESALNEARRIRYAFYVEELGVISPADAPGEMIRDAHDEGARVFLGLKDGRPLITCRLIDIRARPFEMSQFIDPHAFLIDERAAEVTRFICRPDGRYSAVVWHLMARIYQDCVASGIQHLYYSKRENKTDESLSRFFAKLGAVCVSRPFEYGAYGFHRAYRIDLRSVILRRLSCMFRRRLPGVIPPG